MACINANTQKRNLPFFGYKFLFGVKEEKFSPKDSETLINELEKRLKR